MLQWNIFEKQFTFLGPYARTAGFCLTRHYPRSDLVTRFMDTNDICRRLRYALQLDDSDTAQLMSSGGHPADVADAACWRTKEGDADYRACPDAALGALLSGLVLDRRGPPQEGAAPARQPDPAVLTNNAVLKSVKIALSMRSEDVRDCVVAGGGQVTTSEVGSLLRGPGARNFRSCGDQMLRRFLTGLAERQRGSTAAQDS